MKTEELIGLGLTQEQADKILAMNGKDINELKSKAEGLEATTTELNTQLAARNADIEELKKVDAKGLQTKLSELQDKYDNETKELTAKLQKQSLDSKIDFALTTAKAKNLTAVKALLKHEEIKLDGDKLLGFDDQLQSVIKDNPYLFGEAEKNPAPGAGASVVVTKDQFTKMGYSDRVKLKTEQPQIYETLKGER